jgi:hypothetical protein
MTNGDSQYYAQYDCTNKEVRGWCTDSSCRQCQLIYDLAKNGFDNCTAVSGLGSVIINSTRKCSARNDGWHLFTYDTQQNCKNLPGTFMTSNFLSNLTKGQSKSFSQFQIVYGGHDFMIFDDDEDLNDVDGSSNGSYSTPIIFEAGDCIYFEGSWYAVLDHVPSFAMCPSVSSSNSNNAVILTVFILTLSFVTCGCSWFWIADSTAGARQRCIAAIEQIDFLTPLRSCGQQMWYCTLRCCSCCGGCWMGCWIMTINGLCSLKEFIVAKIQRSTKKWISIYLILISAQFIVLLQFFSTESLFEDPISPDVQQHLKFLNFNPVENFFQHWDKLVTILFYIWIVGTLLSGFVRELPRLYDRQETFGSDSFWCTMAESWPYLGLMLLLIICGTPLLLFPLTSSASVEPNGSLFLNNPQNRQSIASFFGAIFVIKSLPVFLFMLLMVIYAIPFGVVTGAIVSLNLKRQELSISHSKDLKIKLAVPCLSLIFSSITLLLLVNQIMNPESESIVLWITNSIFALFSLVLLSICGQLTLINLNRLFLYCSVWAVIHFLVMNSIISNSLYVPNKLMFWAIHLVSVGLAILVSAIPMIDMNSQKRNSAAYHHIGQGDKESIQNQESSEGEEQGDFVLPSPARYEELPRSPDARPSVGGVAGLKDRVLQFLHNVGGFLTQRKERTWPEVYGYRSKTRRIELLVAVICFWLGYIEASQRLSGLSVDQSIQSILVQYGASQDSVNNIPNLSSTPFYLGMQEFVDKLWMQLHLWLASSIFLLLSLMIELFRSPKIQLLGPNGFVPIASILFVSSLFVVSSPHYVQVAELDQYCPDCGEEFNRVFKQILESEVGAFFAVLEAPKLAPLFFFIVLTLLRGFRWTAQEKLIHNKEVNRDLIIQVGFYTPFVLLGPLGIILQSFYYNNQGVDGFGLFLAIMIAFTPLLASLFSKIFQYRISTLMISWVVLVMYVVCLVTLVIYAVARKFVDLETVFRVAWNAENISFAFAEFFLMGVILEDRLIWYLGLNKTSLSAPASPHTNPLDDDKKEI